MAQHDYGKTGDYFLERLKHYRFDWVFTTTQPDYREDPKNKDFLKLWDNIFTAQDGMCNDRESLSYAIKELKAQAKSDFKTAFPEELREVCDLDAKLIGLLEKLTVEDKKFTEYLFDWKQYRKEID